MGIIKLESEDKQLFEVEVEVASCSEMIKTMLETLEGEDDGDDLDFIPIQNVSGVVLGKILEWAAHHKDDPKPAAEAEEGERQVRAAPAVLDAWDEKFFEEIGRDTLFDLVRAANFLDVKGLLEIACGKVCRLMEGKTPEEMRHALRIKNDLLPSSPAGGKKEADANHQRSEEG